MQVWLFLFLFSCFVICHNYAGYAIIVVLLNKLKGKSETEKMEVPFYPSVSFIVAAFNEQDCIEAKILNSLGQDYPADKIEFIFVSDGSSDLTATLIAGYPQIKGLHDPRRAGKPAAMHRGILHATGEILIFSDANTVLNKDAVRNITRHYRFPETGGVAGEKRVLAETADGKQVGEGEGLYWKYESFLKKIDSDFYSVVGAAGELFSVRKDLYEPVPPNAILDDFVISLKVAQQGFRIIYEPAAQASELPSFSIKDEQKRKVRIAAGGFQSIVMLRGLLAFWKHPRLSFLYISHRVLRWAATPFCLVIALVSNIALVLVSEHKLFSALLICQAIFYGMAITAKLVPAFGRNKLFKLPYYFVFMNVSVIQGFFRFLRGEQSILWEKAKRTTAEPVA